ncbi:MAG TPA: LacI family DNA-binding transcriptional regulator [Devosia sp.]|jgi:DNA-binding LacI/PurR family transcriptional regulator|nr:LacI family DNA-binding transcriptional regulator [Devosia sp.]
MRPKAVTLSEVAKMAGVSTATINRVLKGDTPVSPKTKAKVEEVLAATRYRPNAAARNLRTKRTFTIGQMLTSIVDNPLFVGVAAGVEAAAEAAGYRTILFNHENDPRRERSGVDGFIAQDVDAVLFCTSTSADNVEAIAAAGIPVVEIERSLSGTTPFVRIDNLAGAKAAMQHLVELGHRRIAFIGGDPELFSKDARRGRSVEDDRLEAYRESLTDAMIAYDPELVRLGFYYSTAEGDPSGEGRRHAESLLALKDRPTAIFATCDILAAGVLQAIHSHGLRVPNDISVVGFDDTLALNLTPSLTTVSQPMAKAGRLAFEIAHALIQGSSAELFPELRSELRVRNSTAKAKRVDSTEKLVLASS